MVARLPELRGPLTAAPLARHARPCGAARRARRSSWARALALDDLAGGGRVGARDRAEALRGLQLLAEPALCAAGARAGAALRRLLGARQACVRGDRLRLAQAVANLLANALEHGGGRVELRAPRRPARPLEVLDAGPGLPAPVAL